MLHVLVMSAVTTFSEHFAVTGALGLSTAKAQGNPFHLEQA